MPAFMRLFYVIALLGLSGCSALRKAWPGKAPPRAERVRGLNPLRVGTVTLVNEEQRFAVIDTGALPVPPPGTALRAFGDGAETGILAVGDVSRRPVVVADVVKGMPRRGDVVFR